MAELRSKTGILRHHDGCAQPARFYYGADEEIPAVRSQIDPNNHATWIEPDGTVGIRRGTSVSVGPSRTYSAHYDAVDWGSRESTTRASSMERQPLHDETNTDLN